MRTLILLLPVVLVVYVSVLEADTILVPSQQPTIQTGINAASHGDTVLVADGTYTGYGNRDIDFNGKAIVVKSEHGAENCFIDCEGSISANHRGFYFHNGETSLSVVQGFTIQNGLIDEGGAINCVNYSSPSIVDNWIIRNSAELGGGIHCANNSDAIIKRNIIIENSAIGFGGGIRCSNSAVLIEKNLIVANSAYSPTYGGGGIYINDTSSVIIDGNTIAENLAATYGGGIFCIGASPPIWNSILWNNFRHEIYVVSGNPTVAYCDVQGGWPGEGNIDDDPLFVDPENNDFHLTRYSPCIDAGDPSSPLDPDGTRIDMGAYFFDQIMLTLIAIPDTTHYHKGDTLGFTVTVINFTDSTVFLNGWTELVTPDSIHISPLIKPVSGVIGSQDSVVAHISQYVPYESPYGGPYEYIVRVGKYPDEVYAEDSFELFIIAPDIHVEVVSDTTHYHRGEMMGFTVTVTNNEDTTVCIDGWSEGETPWGDLITPLLGPTEFEIGAGMSLSDHYSQFVPLHAPFGGPYIYRTRAGKYHSDVFGEDSFEFFVVPIGVDQLESRYVD